MQNKELIDYFISETNKKFDAQNVRFDSVDEKLSQLIGFRSTLIGGAIAVSAIVSFVIELIFKLKS